jgi:hypothetical protein
MLPHCQVAGEAPGQITYGAYSVSKVEIAYFYHPAGKIRAKRHWVWQLAAGFNSPYNPLITVSESMT